MQRFLRLVLAVAWTGLIGYVMVDFGQTVGPGSLAFAFFINWFLMAWAYFLGRLIPLKFPAGYFVPRAFEFDGKFYRAMGLRHFQKLLRITRLGKINADLTLLSAHQDGLARLENVTHTTETAHMLIFVIVLGVNLYALVMGWWIASLAYLVFNLIFNLYPVMSQRYTRLRYLR